MAEPVQVETAPVPESIDTGQIKSMLNLPETAKDVEVISALVQLIAGLQQKYDALLGDAVALEDNVANRDLQDFGELITPESKDFWKDQLLKNREGTLGVLMNLRQAQVHPEPEPNSAPAPQQRPLFRNRLLSSVKSMAEIAEDVPPITTLQAVKIRNRAQEIRNREKIPYALAFARAEKEIE